MAHERKDTFECLVTTRAAGRPATTTTRHAAIFRNAPGPANYRQAFICVLLGWLARRRWQKVGGQGGGGRARARNLGPHLDHLRAPLGPGACGGGGGDFWTRGRGNGRRQRARANELVTVWRAEPTGFMLIRVRAASSCQCRLALIGLAPIGARQHQSSNTQTDGNKPVPLKTVPVLARARPGPDDK